MAENNFPITEEAELKNNINSYFSKHYFSAHIIYTSILALLVIACIAMKIVQVPVYLRTRGLIRPSTEVNHVLSPVQGIIQEINVSENQYVQSSQVVIILESAKETLQQGLMTEELSNLRIWMNDLEKIENRQGESPKLVSPRYQIDYQLFKQQLGQVELKLGQAKTDLQRFKKLLKEDFISGKEYETAELQFKTIDSDRNQLIAEKQRQWGNESIEFKNRENILLKQISETGFYIDKSKIKSPETGIIQGIRNRFPGEFCAQGTELFSLVPDTVMIAELLIAPKDIGFIYPGQKARLLIDAYDYKYWGAVPAECSSVSQDIEIVENQAFFRVVCTLEPKAFLEYRHTRLIPGAGMTLTAQFLVSEKNIWQLLRDKAYNLAFAQNNLEE